MTTLSEATAAPVPVTIDGETYLISPRTNEDYGTLENWIKAKLVQIARESIDENTSPEMQELTIDRALIKAATTDWYSKDGLAIVNSGAGLEFRMWLGMRHNHPKLTLATVRGLLKDHRAEILDAFNLTQANAKKNEPNATGRNP